MSSSSIKANSIAESEDVIVCLVLKSVLVDINTSSLVSQTSIDQELMGFAWGIDAGGVEILFNYGSSVDILENCNLSLVLVMLDLDHLPAKHHVNPTLVAFFKRNLVGVGESVDLFIGCPVLNTSVVGGTAVQLILSHEVLVVKGIEISAFTFVWELW